MGAKDLGGESRNRTHVAGISGPICFRGSAITALASLRDRWRKVSDSNARGAHAPIRLATGANRPLWQPSDLLRYGWGSWIRTNVDLLQRQGPYPSATPQSPSTARPTMHVSLVSIEDSIETAIEMNDSLRTARTANVSIDPEGFVYCSQIVREHVSTAFCRAQRGGHRRRQNSGGLRGTTRPCAQCA